MSIIDQIGKSLNSNKNLSNDVKRNLFELSIIFNNRFPDIDLTNLDNRLKSLKIDSISKFVQSEVASYDPITNTLSINLEEIQKNHDTKHIMMHELLHIISAKENNYGFDKDNNLIALNTGYTEMLTNNLVGNDSDNDYHIDEVIATNIIANMIGEDILFESYFSNDYNKINNVLENAGL